MCAGNDLEGLFTARAAERCTRPGRARRPARGGREAADGTPPALTSRRAAGPVQRRGPGTSGPSSPRTTRSAPKRRPRRHRDPRASGRPRGTSSRGWPGRTRVGRRARPPTSRRSRHRRPRASCAPARARPSPTSRARGTSGFDELELLKRVEPGVPGDVPGRRLPAPGPVLDRRPHGDGSGPVHRPARLAPDHPRRGRRRRDVDVFRRTPLHEEHLALGAPDGSLRELVAAVALRRRGRRVLGGARGRVDRRRQHARQAGRVRPRCRRGPGAALSVPRRGHQARPLALRAAAQRARPRHGRRDDPARVRDPVRPDLHVRRRGQRRDVDPRLDRRRGASASTSSTGRCRSPRSTSRGRSPGSCCAGRPGRAAALPRPRPRRCRRRAVPRHAPVVHGRGGLGAAPPGRPVGGAVAGAHGRWARTSASGRTGSRRCSGCGSRRATSSSAWTPSSTRRRAGSAWTGRCAWTSRGSSAGRRWSGPAAPRRAALDRASRWTGRRADRGRADLVPMATIVGQRDGELGVAAPRQGRDARLAASGRRSRTGSRSTVARRS